MFDDDFEDRADDFVDELEQAEPLPLRTFRLWLDIYGEQVEEFVQAMSYSVTGDVVQFYTLRPMPNGDHMLVNHRSYRLWLEVEDITDNVVAAQSELVN